MTITSITNRTSSPSGRDDLRNVLTDSRFDRPTRLLRLQGWRGAELATAVSAGGAHRIAPGACAALAWVVAITGSLPIAVATLATAVVGAFASNHPFEIAYNVLVRLFGGNSLPSNRAAKRLGCAIGSLFFASSTATLAVDQVVAGRVIAGVMAVVATVVAVSNVCVPSMMFTLAWGSHRATAPTLVGAARYPATPGVAIGPRSTTWVPVAGYTKR